MTSTIAKPNPAESKPDPSTDLKTMSIADVEKELRSSPDGLTDVEAKKRLAQYGPNGVTEGDTPLHSDN